MVEKARSFQVAGLNLEGVETAIAVGVEPFAKRIAGIGQWRVVWPAAAILLPIMLYTGLTHRRRIHLGLAILFSILWLGTFVTGIFFLPHDLP